MLSFNAQDTKTIQQRSFKIKIHSYLKECLKLNQLLGMQSKIVLTRRNESNDFTWKLLYAGLKSPDKVEQDSREYYLRGEEDGTKSGFE